MNFKNMSKHTDNKGNVRMIDISDKDITKRVAKAEGYIELSKEALDSIVNNVNKKGDVLTVAQIAGITGAKQTSRLVPLSHQVNLKSIQISFEIKKNGIRIQMINKIKISLIQLQLLIKITKYFYLVVK